MYKELKKYIKKERKIKFDNIINIYVYIII